VCVYVYIYIYICIYIYIYIYKIEFTRNLGKGCKDFFFLLNEIITLKCKYIVSCLALRNRVKCERNVAEGTWTFNHGERDMDT
jgi:hypothetical protein